MVSDSARFFMSLFLDFLISVTKEARHPIENFCFIARSLLTIWVCKSGVTYRLEGGAEKISF